MSRFRILTILLLSLIPKAQATLYINEIMPKNVSYVMDENWNFSMWAEVYNVGAEALNLNDFYFTDNLKKPAKWRPDTGVVQPGGYFVLWFEREEFPHHASFKLDSEGNELYLLDLSLKVVDSMTYPAQYRNISYGRVRDATSGWTFFSEPSPGASNNGKTSASERCGNPGFSLEGGYYYGTQSLTLTAGNIEDKLYYTLDGTEPTQHSQRYESPIELKAKQVVRVRAFRSGFMPSDVMTRTFFVNERKTGLRVVSLTTDPRYLTNDTVGIYCEGINGILGNLQKTPKNFNRDWDRPVHFELFDESGTQVLSQELDVHILGGGSREHALKSLAISPKKKFGETRLNYDFFRSKPGLEYKGIMLRNSGNDYGRTMMKDAFIQSLVMNRMDVDYQAYEPGVLYINGDYRGIENQRERHNKDWIFSNFGLDEDDTDLIEATYKDVDSHNDMATDSAFAELGHFLKTHPMSDPANYQLACQRIDADEFINYLIPELYCGNTDWPYNNVKMWRAEENGRWRWILLDTEYSFGLKRASHNSLTFALGENLASLIGGYATSGAPEWSTVVFAQLIKNETFRNAFIDRFCIHLSTTFETNRVVHVRDSLAARIRNEIPYFLERYGEADNFEGDLAIWKIFSEQRPATMLGFISARFLDSAMVKTVRISSNHRNATYRFNGQPVLDNEALISTFAGRSVTLEADSLPGYRFKSWLKGEQIVSTKALTVVMNGNLSVKAMYEEVGTGFEAVRERQPIRLYPTRTRLSLTVCEAEGKAVIVHDLTGRLILETLCSSNLETLSVEALAPGLYVMTVDGHSYKFFKE